MGKKQIVKSPQVIFLVGAGASVPFGIPAMRGMFDAFMKNKNPEIDKAKKRICNLLTNEFKVEKDLEEFLLATNAIVDFKSTCISQLIAKVVSPKRDSDPYRKYRTKLDSYINDAKLIRKSILDFTSRTCFQFDRTKAHNVLGGFVKTIAKRGYPVYTTNYDFAFEHVAIDMGIKIHDNFIKKGQRQIWNPNIDFTNGDGLTIIPMHGSVTWYTDGKGVIEKVRHYTDVNPAGHSIERVVVFPTRFKDIYEQHFFSLYSHFLSALSNANCLVVIGHSLRDEYLRAGIIERCRDSNFKVIIIDPKFPEELAKEMNHAKIGSSGKITHVPYSFEKFSDEIASIISNAEPVDIADACAEIVHHNRFKKNKIKLKGDIRTLKANEEKKFGAVIDAYLQPHEKPAYVRVWLEATYKKDGLPRGEVSGAFLENREIKIAAGLSGMVNEQLPITINVPAYPNWLNHAEKVTLCIAILKRNVKKPQHLLRSILVKDSRELRYTGW